MCLSEGLCLLFTRTTNGRPHGSARFFSLSFAARGPQPGGAHRPLQAPTHTAVLSPQHTDTFSMCVSHSALSLACKEQSMWSPNHPKPVSEKPVTTAATQCVTPFTCGAFRRGESRPRKQAGAYPRLEEPEMQCLWVQGLLWGSGTRKWWWPHIGSAPKATHLFVLKWFILCPMNFTSIKKIYRVRNDAFNNA